MPRKKKNTWANSEGRKLLRSDIRKGRIPADMDWEIAFARRPEFAFGKTPEEAKRLFKTRLQTARTYVHNKLARAAEELRLYRQDRQVYPPSATMNSGEPRWDGSNAQRLLKQDVEEGIHLTMTPAQFYAFRPEYQEFLKRTITDHVQQEESTSKFLKQYRARYGEGEGYNSDDGDSDPDDQHASDEGQEHEELELENDDDDGETDDEDSS